MFMQHQTTFKPQAQPFWQAFVHSLGAVGLYQKPDYSFFDKTKTDMDSMLGDWMSVGKDFWTAVDQQGAALEG